MNFMPNQPSEQKKSSPYTEGRKEWNERYGSYIAQRDNWRKATFAALGLAAVAVGSNVWLASQSKVEPYVVAIDKLGDAIAVGPADRTTLDNPRAVRRELDLWVKNVRTVTTDHDAATRNVEEAYAATDKSGPALQVLNAWYSSHDPYRRASNGVVLATISYIRFRGGHTWIVGWREEERPVNQPAPLPVDWEMEVVISSSPSNDADGIKANPLGIYVHSFNWGIRQ